MDPTALLAAAARVDADADVIRARARVLAHHGSRLRWHSPAARRFGTSLDEAIRLLLRAAAAGDELAERLRTHAARVMR